jgi:hypothetical protein
MKLSADRQFADTDKAAPQAGERSMTKPGIDADGIAENEADHFMMCPVCSQWFDMCDLAQVVEHIHDSEIEVQVGPVPLRREGLVH